MTNTFSCRIQYLDDSNPFHTTNFPEPTRPLSYAFLTSVPLSNQIANVHAALSSPLKVFTLFILIFKMKISTSIHLPLSSRHVLLLNFLYIFFFKFYSFVKILLDRGLCFANLQAKRYRDRVRLLFRLGAVS